MSKPQHENAFTLIELLVVIAIIGILASLLLPVLAGAKKKARTIKSVSNQKQIGAGYVGYLGDHDGWFPRVAGPASVGGKQGDGMGNKGKLPKLVAQLYGASVPENERPLNEYVGDPKIFHDPSDIGGGVYVLPSCWESLGNSYQPQAADDMFRVKRVLGEKSEPAESYEGTSMHESELTTHNAVDKKIIQGDWNWPYDREDAWHGVEGIGRHVMLYGDFHVEQFVFPPTSTLLKWQLQPPPDPAFTWW